MIESRLNKTIGRELEVLNREKNEKNAANYVLDQYSSKSSSSATNSLPLNSLTLDNTSFMALISFSAFGGCRIKIIIPENCSDGNITELRKSLSLETKTHFFSSAKDANLPLLMPFGAYSAEYPFDSKNFLSKRGIFSSSRNFSVSDTMSSSYHFSCPLQSILDHNLSQSWIIILNNFLMVDIGSHKFDNIANQNSCAFESGLSMADFTVSNYILANFDSHNADNGNPLFKAFDSESGISVSTYIKVKLFLET